MELSPTIHAGSFGIQDSLFLMLLALVVFGPRRLPEIGRQIGKLMYEFRKVSNDFKFQMEEELRASEEVERQRKLEAAMAVPVAVPAALPAASQVTLDVPPHPAPAESVPARLEASTDSSTNNESIFSAGNTGGAPDASGLHEAPGDVEPEPPRGEPRKFPPPPRPAAPEILPPSMGEQVAAARPFRGRVEEPAAAAAEVVTESGSEPSHEVTAPVVVADEGRIGTEVQPGVTPEREAHHA